MTRSPVPTPGLANPAPAQPHRIIQTPRPQHGPHCPAGEPLSGDRGAQRQVKGRCWYRERCWHRGRPTETQTLVPADRLRRDPLSPCQTPGGAQSQGALTVCAGSVWENGPALPEPPPHLPTQSSSHLCAVSHVEHLPVQQLGPRSWQPQG